jgi:hypothetical protein
MMGVPRAMLVGPALTSYLCGVKPLDMVSYLLALNGWQCCTRGECGACWTCGECRPKRPSIV